MTPFEVQSVCVFEIFVNSHGKYRLPVISYLTFHIQFYVGTQRLPVEVLGQYLFSDYNMMEVSPGQNSRFFM